MTMYTAAGWVVIGFTGVVGGAILYLILSGRIDLSRLLSEEGSGKASLSRFQFLIFTFVVAMGLLVVIFDTGEFPDLPNSVYVLLGISGASYLGSKITQKAAENEASRNR